MPRKKKSNERTEDTRLTQSEIKAARRRVRSTLKGVEEAFEDLRLGREVRGIDSPADLEEDQQLLTDLDKKLAADRQEDFNREDLMFLRDTFEADNEDIYDKMERRLEEGPAANMATFKESLMPPR